MKQDLSAKKEQIVFGNDSVVIPKYISGIEGGRTLDMTGYTDKVLKAGYTDKVLKAGHVIITDGKGTYKPMPVTLETTTGEGESAVTTPAGYGTLPTGYSYAGVLYRSILTADPAASIMTWGKVNSEAAPYPMTTILAAFKTACPHIEFVKDEEA